MNCTELHRLLLMYNIPVTGVSINGTEFTVYLHGGGNRNVDSIYCNVLRPNHLVRKYFSDYLPDSLIKDARAKRLQHMRKRYGPHIKMKDISCQ